MAASKESVNTVVTKSRFPPRNRPRMPQKWSKSKTFWYQLSHIDRKKVFFLFRGGTLLFSHCITAITGLVYLGCSDALSRLPGIGFTWLQLFQLLGCSEMFRVSYTPPTHIRGYVAAFWVSISRLSLVQPLWVCFKRLKAAAYSSIFVNFKGKPNLEKNSLHAIDLICRHIPGTGLKLF